MLEAWGSVRCVRDIHGGQVVFAWPVSVQGGGDDHVLASQLAGSVGMGGALILSPAAPAEPGS